MDMHGFPDSIDSIYSIVSIVLQKIRPAANCQLLPSRLPSAAPEGRTSSELGRRPRPHWRRWRSRWNWPWRISGSSRWGPGPVPVALAEKSGKITWLCWGGVFDIYCILLFMFFFPMEQMENIGKSTILGESINMCDDLWIFIVCFFPKIMKIHDSCGIYAEYVWSLVPEANLW